MSIYHYDPEKNIEALTQADPDYINPDDVFDAKGFEMLKNAMNGGGIQIK